MHIPNVPITRRVVYRSGAIRCSLSRVNEARFGLGALALHWVSSADRMAPLSSVGTKIVFIVIVAFRGASTPCPLFPQKQTSLSATRMSALCQKQTSVRFGR